MLSIIVGVIILSFHVGTVSAHHKLQVLGEATSASQLNFPAIVSAGPGFILPDSPFYFLDQFVQSVRLSLSFSPERRAQLQEQIAQERLAELRVMLTRNNTQGIDTALEQLTKESGASAQSLKDAASQGKDVKALAKQLNETIKTQRKILNILANQADKSLKLQLKAAREELKDAKIEIEDELPEDELENEIEDELDIEIEDEVEEASSSAKGLEHAIDVLSKLASQAAERGQESREEALRHAIEVKNDALIKQLQKFIENEGKKQEKLFQTKQKALKEAREAAKKAQEAAVKFREAHKESKEIRNTPAENLNNSGSGENGSSKAGSSNSGKSESSGSGSSGSGKDDGDN